MREPFTVTLDQRRGVLRREAGDWFGAIRSGIPKRVGAVVFARTYELLD
jgi:hypothetical protein